MRWQTKLSGGQNHNQESVTGGQDYGKDSIFKKDDFFKELDFKEDESNQGRFDPVNLIPTLMGNPLQRSSNAQISTPRPFHNPFFNPTVATAMENKSSTGMLACKAEKYLQ